MGWRDRAEPAPDPTRPDDVAPSGWRARAEQAPASSPDLPATPQIGGEDAETLALGNKLSLGLAPRALAARDAVLGEDSAHSGNAPRTPWETLTALYNKVKQLREAPPDISSQSPMNRMRDLYSKNKAFYDQGFRAANEQNPGRSFIGKTLGTLAVAPLSMAQSAVGAGLDALSTPDYTKLAAGDKNEALNAATNVGGATALGAAGFELPLATAIGMGGYNEIDPNLTDAQRTEGRYGALSAIVPALAGHTLGGVSKAANAAEGINQGARGVIGDRLVDHDVQRAGQMGALQGRHELANEAAEQRRVDQAGAMGKLQGQHEANQAKALEDFNTNRENALAADQGAANVENKAHDFRLSDRFKALLGKRIEAAQNAEIGKQYGDVLNGSEPSPDSLRAKIEKAINIERGPKAGSDLLQQSASDFDQAQRDADQFKDAIPERVAQKRRAELGVLINRAANHKALGREVPSEVNQAIDIYERNSPNLANEILTAGNPDTLSEAYRQKLLAEHAQLQAKASALLGAAPAAMLGKLDANRVAFDELPPQEPQTTEPVLGSAAPSVSVDDALLRHGGNPRFKTAEDLKDYSGLYGAAQLFPETENTQVGPPPNVAEALKLPSTPQRGLSSSPAPAAGQGVADQLTPALLSDSLARQAAREASPSPGRIFDHPDEAPNEWRRRVLDRPELRQSPPPVSPQRANELHLDHAQMLDGLRGLLPVEDPTAKYRPQTKAEYDKMPVPALRPTARPPLPGTLPLPVPPSGPALHPQVENWINSLPNRTPVGPDIHPEVARWRDEATARPPMPQRIDQHLAETPLTNAVFDPHTLGVAHSPLAAIKAVWQSPELRAKVFGNLSRALQTPGSVAARYAPVLGSFASIQAGAGLARLNLLMQHDPKLAAELMGTGEGGGRSRASVAADEGNGP